MEGIHYWATGAVGNEHDLAGLVCNNLKPGEDSDCINPKKGSEEGDTWEKREAFIRGCMHEFERAMKNQRGES
jgi:hypothetical protein